MARRSLCKRGMELHCSALTHVGRRRNNEDAHALRPDLGLVVVADGMGGYEGGEVASHLVVQSLVELFERTQIDPEATWPHQPRPTRDPLLDRVWVGLRHAHARVLAQRQGVLARMGSTAAVVAWQGEHLAIGHVGDSRVYRLRLGRLERLTRDHSFAEEALAAGMPSDAAAVTSYRHVLTRAVGMPGPLEADLCIDRLRPGDVLLVCSDGVWEPLHDEELCAALEHAPRDAAQSLVAWAYEAGGTDNMTALVLRVGHEPMLAQQGA